MKYKKTIIIVVCVVLFIAMVHTVVVFFRVWDRGFTVLTNWQVGWAITDSIGSYYGVNRRLPESWDEVKDSYIANEFHISGYGFDVHKLDEAIGINFQFLQKINHLKALGHQQSDIEIEWILRLKSSSNSKFLEEQNDRLHELIRRVLVQPTGERK